MFVIILYMSRVMSCRAERSEVETSGCGQDTRSRMRPDSSISSLRDSSRNDRRGLEEGQPTILK